MRSTRSHEREDVVDEGGGERRLPRERVEHLRLVEQLDADSDRGRSERAAHREAVGVDGAVKERRDEGHAAKERQARAQDGDGERARAHLRHLAEVDVHARFHDQQRHAQSARERPDVQRVRALPRVELQARLDGAKAGRGAGRGSRRGESPGVNLFALPVARKRYEVEALGPENDARHQLADDTRQPDHPEDAAHQPHDEEKGRDEQHLLYRHARHGEVGEKSSAKNTLGQTPCDFWIW